MFAKQLNNKIRVEHTPSPSNQNNNTTTPDSVLPIGQTKEESDEGQEDGSADLTYHDFAVFDGHNK